MNKQVSVKCDGERDVYRQQSAVAICVLRGYQSVHDTNLDDKGLAVYITGNSKPVYINRLIISR